LIGIADTPSYGWRGLRGWISISCAYKKRKEEIP
jgi:hypothetical protein